MLSPVKNNRIIRLAALLLCAFFVLACTPAPAQAEAEGKTVRVGWYDSSFNTKDKDGRRSGYAYEYQMKVAAYTGWRYEYVNGSWSDLLQMLQDGEIDLMSDVSYTEERSKKMLYASLPMGAEEYYIFIAPGNNEISSDDYSTLNGKLIGVNKDSIQETFLKDWAKQQGINIRISEQTCSEDESFSMLKSGKLDAYVTPDAFVDPTDIVPVCRIGSSDFFFAVSKSRPDLLSELNRAMSSIQDEDRYYNQKMFDKFTIRAGANTILTNGERNWLKGHGKIRVGYQDDYLAFCAQDKESGELTGALKDYLEYASDCFENAHIDFETKAYPTAAEAISALKNNEIDCVFPANLSPYYGETLGIVMTPPMISSDMLAVVREADQKAFAERNHVIVAVNKGNPNYDALLKEKYPDWQIVYFPTTSDCLKAISQRVADCILVSGYRYNNISRECKKYDLTGISTGIIMDYCFAVRTGDTELYSIMSRTTGLMPASTMNSLMSYYITEDARMDLHEYLMDHLDVTLAVAVMIILVFLMLLVRSMRAEKRAAELIAATETDDLTGLYNRDFFLEYAGRMHRESPDTPMDAIVLNIEQFHSVNELKGREFGDHVLRVLGSEIHDIADENAGIAGRFDADRFDIYCRHMEDYQASFDRLQSRLDSLAPNTSIRLRMGVMQWQPDLEPVEMFDRARTACSMARGHYKEHLIVFDNEVREREMLEQRLLSDMRRALDGYQFEVYYQPKYDIRSNPPKLVSAEALIRWNHPELGMIPPDEFIPLFERCGKIGEIDKYVWAEAARQIVRWRGIYGVTIPVSVNLSRVDVFDPDLEETLESILRYNGLDRDALLLEVTETAYTENADQVVRVVENLRSKGFEVEMDDFGTGYSSLNMLSEMPVDVLKMDRAFVRNIEHNEKDIQLVALIIDIAKKLDVPVVAEGVETESQLEMLRKLGCELVQGYYFSRPLPSAEFERTIIQKLQ